MRGIMKKEHECSPPANDLVFEVKLGLRTHRLDDLEHTHAFAFAEVVRLVACLRRTVVEDLGLWCQCVQRKQMTLCQVEDMQVVAYAGAVTLRPPSGRRQRKRTREIKTYGVV